MVRLAASVIQPAPVAPLLEQMAQDVAVRVRRDARDGVCRPVPGVARGDSSRMIVPFGTFRLEHDVLSGKSNGELFPTAFQSKFKTASHAKPSTPRILGTCFDRVNMSN